jgi:transcriptional regulator with XRE-family HTH domain
LLRVERKEPVALRHDHEVPSTAEEAAGTWSGFTIADVGRTLSRERNRHGLSLQDVSGRTGIPADQLRAAETGVLDRPDGLATLKTVRRYADFLGLPGDRFALAILEHWPTKAGVPRPFGRPDDAGRGVSGNGTAAHPRPDDTAVHLRPDDTAVHTLAAGPGGEPTRSVGRVGRAERVAWEDTGKGRAVGGYGSAYSDTGVTPAVAAPASQVWRRPRRRAPFAIQALVVVVILALVAGVALLAVDRLKPSWLRDAGLLHGATPAVAAAAGHARHAAGSHSSDAASTTAALKPRTNRGTAVFDVPASRFSVKLSSTGGPCWVDVTTNTSSTPVFAGVLDGGGSRTFANVHSFVVEIGSTSGRVSVTSSHGHVATYTPPGAPYKVVVRSAHPGH